MIDANTKNNTRRWNTCTPSRQLHPPSTGTRVGACDSTVPVCACGECGDKLALLHFRITLTPSTNPLSSTASPPSPSPPSTPNSTPTSSPFLPFPPLPFFPPLLKHPQCWHRQPQTLDPRIEVHAVSPFDCRVAHFQMGGHAPPAPPTPPFTLTLGGGVAGVVLMPLRSWWMIWWMGREERGQGRNCGELGVWICIGLEAVGEAVE
jgi:hypothetical protein